MGARSSDGGELVGHDPSARGTAPAWRRRSLQAHHRRRRAVALAVVAAILALIAWAISGAGGGTTVTPHALTGNVSASSWSDTDEAACANTFREIVQGAESPANEYADIPAWFNYFSSNNQARGLPVVIGQGAYLTANGASAGAFCSLTFDIPGTTPPGAMLTYRIGDTSFSGPNPPLLGPPVGPHLPNVVIGPDGALSAMSQ